LGESACVVELRRVLQLAQGGKLRVQPKVGRPTPATERLISASLAAPEFDLEPPADVADDHIARCGPVRAHAWAVLVQQCGWCKASGDALKLTRAGAELLRETTPAALRDGVGQLVLDDSFDELQRINNIRGQGGKGRRWMTKPGERREAILDGMSQWPVNEWMTFDEAYRFLNACGNDYTVTQEPMYLYFCEQRYGYLIDQDDIDRQYLRVLLFESLATLGLVDVAYVYPHYLWPELGGGWGTDDMEFCGRYDGLLYVRLNSLGAYCLDVTNDYTPPAAERRSLFTVLPNREIAVTGGQQLLPGDVSMLESIARKRSEHLWRLEQPRVLDYLEDGGSLDDLLRFLSENAAEELPETVRVWINDLQARSAAVVGAGKAWLIEFLDPAVAALVANDSKAGKLCLAAGDRHVAVPVKSERAFRTAVKKLGYVLRK
jgi:hypothetical protein